MIFSPERQQRARIANQENVDCLEHSLATFGLVNEHVEVVLFINGTKPLSPKPGLKWPLTAEEMIAAGFEGYFTICGDHTQRAMNQPHRKWARLNVTVYVWPRSTESYAIPKSWGRQKSRREHPDQNYVAAWSFCRRLNSTTQLGTRREQRS